MCSSQTIVGQDEVLQSWDTFINETQNMPIKKVTFIPNGKSWGRHISCPVYLKESLSHLVLMEKMPGNAAECVLVKLTLKMFNRCLRLITLKSGDRLDKLMALFIMEKMNLSKRGRKKRAVRRGICSFLWAVIFHSGKGKNCQDSQPRERHS